jgi:putative transposase
MLILLSALLSSLGSLFRSRAALQLENIAIRHQIGVLKRSAGKRPKLTAADRLLWVCLSRVWRGWRSALDIFKPATAIAWYRKGFRLFWTWKIRHGRAGRPPVSCEVRDLIRRMSHENPLFGAPISTGNCSNWISGLVRPAWRSTWRGTAIRPRKPGVPSWTITSGSLVSVDFFTVPTIRFQVLYVFLLLAHDRAGWSTLISPRIPRRNGRHSNMDGTATARSTSL